MQRTAGTYTAQVVDGVLKLLQAAERHLPVVRVSPQGAAVEAVPYSSISPAFAAAPVLRATWAGDGYANVDLDCGAQRFDGTKSLRWIRSGLYNAGFGKRDVDALFRQMRKVGPQNTLYPTACRA